MSSIHTKVALREKAIEARSVLKGDARHQATDGATRRAFDRLGGTTGLIGLYVAFRDEINALALMEALAEAGRHLALPCTPRFGDPLTFRAWAPGDLAITRAGSSQCMGCSISRGL
jgi:5-formyltetrahydrofolate cyclo-ligase